MLHTLYTTNKKKKRIGRGGARGKNSGHGDKGQRSRAGHKIRPSIRDVIQRIPKKRGHNKNRAKTVREDKVVRTVTLAMLEKNFQKGDIVTPLILTQKRIISNVRGLTPKVKIVSTGDVSISLIIKRCFYTDTVKEKIEKAGGSVEHFIKRNKATKKKTIKKVEKKDDTNGEVEKSSKSEISKKEEKDIKNKKDNINS